MSNPAAFVETSQRAWPGSNALPYGLYVLIVASLWLPYSRQLNADGVSYLSIAAEYAAGDWWTAVNTYWSPLFSWLLALGIAIKAQPLLFARFLLAVSGLLGLAAFGRLLSIFEVNHTIKAFALVAALPMFCYFGLHDVTPDVLVVALLELYLSLTCAKHITNTQWRYAGALGALLYLAKAYCFVFVIAHLLITGVIRIYVERNAAARRNAGRACALAIAIMLLLCAPWLFLISVKAGRPTISTAGAYNLRLATSGKSGHPMLSHGLFAPPNPKATSIWENPDAMRLPAGGALFPARLRVIVRNLGDFARYELQATVLLPVILGLFAYVSLSRWFAGERDFSAVCLLAAYVIYPAAYLVTFVEHRYIWIEDVLTVVMAGCIFEWLRDRKQFSPKRLAWIGAAAGISFCCAPLFVVVKHRTDLRGVSELLPSLRQLHLSGTMASNARWDDTQYLAYQLGLRYYGMPARGSAEANEEAMRQNGIRYIFVWHTAGASLPSRPGKELFRSSQIYVYLLD